MGQVPKRPVSDKTPRTELDRVDSEVRRIDRKQQRPPNPLPFVKVEPVAVDEWPPGTAWLDTSGE